MNNRQLALTAVMSALTVVIAYTRGLALPSLPGVFELMTVLIFISGFCFGSTVGIMVGAVSLTIYNLIPYPLAHPAAWLFTISPILLVIMALLGVMFGVAGDIASRFLDPKKPGFAFNLGVVGFVLTFIYDVGSSLGFALAYPAFTDPVQAVYLTFIPLYYPWPPIVHTFTNAIIFAVIAPVLIRAIIRLPETLNIRGTQR